MSRRLIVSLALALVMLAAGSAEAQKRRAVRAPSAAPPPAGNCHTFGLVRAGLIASYQSTPPTNFTVTYIQDTLTKTITKQKVTTPQATADADTIIDGEVVGNLRGIKHINVKATTPVPVLGSITIETDIDFVPSLIAGPLDGWCTGNKWTIPPVTETVVVKSPIAPPTNQIITTIASEGEVLAVGETVVVPAGSFQTVKYKGIIVTDGNVQTAITWTSMVHNIVVKQQTLDAAGNVTSTVELTSVQ
jgi:hypothetical protein